MPEPPRPRGFKISAIAPLLFVGIWSTGWLVAKYVGGHADPLWFLCVRFAIVTLLLGGAIVLFTRLPILIGQKLVKTAWVVGFLVHGVYLGGIFWAISAGLDPSVSGVIAIIQPLTTSIIAVSTKQDRFNARRLIGLAVAVCALIGNFFIGTQGRNIEALVLPIIVNIVSMIAIAIGTHIAAREGLNRDKSLMLVTSFWQFVAATIFMAALTSVMTLGGLASFEFVINKVAISALVWSVLVMSLGATTLWWLINRIGTEVDSSALIFLIPPLVALQAAALGLGSQITLSNWLIISAAATGVWLLQRKPIGLDTLRLLVLGHTRPE